MQRGLVGSEMCIRDRTKTAGTYQFYPPEACDPHNTKGLPGRAGDVWALGVTVYALLFNELPFWGDSIVEIFEAISTKPHVFIKSRDISEKIKILVNKLLEKDPNKRYSPQHLSLIHISEPTRPLYISYAVFCLKKKKHITTTHTQTTQTNKH
eukprot:TRINITY_DN10985_c0_g2_i1.p1 TRINITY_DN10985_c0_g2~~TRINITY_DN10985_c0_g2_i1.p1  ORF type:complete len:153 (-),score=33.53 TRINITY_DN10985_c0_g2_i1:16-474(-)